MTSSAIELVSAAAAKAWGVREQLTVSQWADKYRFLTPKTSNMPGRWETSRTPYTREVMDAMGDPAFSRVTLMMSSQVSKTESVLNFIGWCVMCAPGPMLYILPNETLVADFSQERITPLIESVPELAAEVGEDREDKKVLKIRFASMVLYLAGAGSVANMRGRPIKYRMVDDSEKCKDAAAVIEELEQRGNTFGGGKLIDASVPGLAGHGIDAEYRASDKRFYAVPCPICFAYQELAFEQLRWDGGIYAEEEHARTTCRYKCLARGCGKEFGTERKYWMLARGAWVRDGQSVEVDRSHLAATGEVRALVKGVPRPTRHAGFKLGALYSPFLTFGDIAAGFVKAKGRPAPTWVNGVLGRPWKIKSTRVELEDVRKLAAPPGAGGYKLGTVPKDVLWISAGIDVQTDRIYVQWDGWGEHAARRWLIDFQEYPSTEGDALWVLNSVVKRAFLIAGTEESPRFMPCLQLFIDSGDRTNDVYAACLRLKARGVQPVKGDNGTLGGRPWQENTLKENGLKLLHVGGTYWKDALFASLKLKSGRSETASVADVAGGEPGGSACEFLLPFDVPEEWMRQVTAEEAVTIRRGGQDVKVYQPRASHIANHALDCAVYSAAGADRMGARIITEKNRAGLERMAIRLGFPAYGGGSVERAAGRQGGRGTQITAAGSAREAREMMGR